MTEFFGPIGKGWGYSIKDRWIEHECAFVQVSLWYVMDGERYEAGEQIGGTSLDRTPDEAYKMAITDALMKCAVLLGLSSDIYLTGKATMSKYEEKAPDPILSGSELIKTYLAMLVGYEEPATTYLRGKGWITEEQTFEDLPVEHIKTCVQHKERFLKALQEVGPNPWDDEKGE